MSLEQTINTDLKTAMLAKDEPTVRSLRAIKAAIILAKTSEGNNGTVSEAQELSLLQKLVKQRKDSIEIFQQQNRADLAGKELEEVSVIEKYLPAQLNADELKTALKGIIEKTGAKGPADMGKVMGAANKELAGKADGKSIAAAVKELLQG
ncbi:MAG TPA: GatB/YqeY domain-containing protein [Dinghuibacter sp.]|jgi:uncharacterized protein YqeY|uniref:GatB/YqeY domain-containing protein n=1 Tax=Dinghuibacter sp. TaxID=2024697 RepID=UPI002B99C21B|nr:GatB/YqeY domain-containing protein [Dinghuibacter sp.]HTJ12233.1 GatB/YqeY domain-containing protein [Dinghuibacter sp.]